MMNMPTSTCEEDGGRVLYVSFNATLLALVRTSLKIHCSGTNSFYTFNYFLTLRTKVLSKFSKRHKLYLLGHILIPSSQLIANQFAHAITPCIFHLLKLYWSANTKVHVHVGAMYAHDSIMQLL